MISLLKFSLGIFSGKHAPVEGEHYYHLRMARTLLDNGKRPARDDMSWLPTGIPGNYYPPMLHYVEAAMLFLLSRFGLKGRDARIHGCLAFIFLLLVALGLSMITRRGGFVEVALLLFSSPLILERYVCGGIRGEMVALILLPILFFVCATPESILFPLALPVLLIGIGFSTRTSAYIFLSVALWSILWIPASGLIPAVAGLETLLIWLFCLRWYRVRGKNFYPFRELRWSGCSLKSETDALILDHRKDRVISLEERPQHFFHLVLSAPCVLAGLFLVPYATLPLERFCAIFLVLSSLYSLFARRYLVYALLPAIVLITSKAALFSPLVFAILLNQVFICLHADVRPTQDTMEAIDFIRKDGGDRNSLVIAPWRLGHLITGYGGMKAFWDSNFPGTKRFMAQKAILDQIVSGELSVDTLFQNVKKASKVFLLLELPGGNEIRKGFREMAKVSTYIILIPQ